MSLARAFTKRVKRSESSASEPSTSPLPGRAASMRKDARPINRHEISLPVELLSTTNMLSYNAPDIATLREEASSSSPSSSASSIKSSGSSNKESEHDSSMTDTSSVDDSASPTEPNHLSCYFNAAQSEEKQQLRRSRSSAEFSTYKPAASTDLSAPVVPTRALSHSKRAHEQVARQRSVRGMASTGSIRSMARSSSTSQRSVKEDVAPAAERSLSRSRSSAEQRSSVDMFRSASISEKEHPFGKELEQLDEVAEEFGSAVNDVETLEDVKLMTEQGLMRFCAQEYLSEIHPFQNGFGTVSPMHVGMAWI